MLVTNNSQLQYYYETVNGEQVMVQSDVGITAYVLMVLSEATQLTGVRFT